MGHQHERYERRVGQVLRGKWKLERLIGVGGMAAVYAARHRVGASVAIKILHPEVAHSKQIRKRFEQEAMVMGRLEHPGAVEVRDVDATEDGAPFLVMELLEGESLRERLQRLGSISNDEALRYGDEALDVLAAAHDQNIVHRDIKLDNLFITTAGGLKVLDFGIARMREGTALTMVGTRLGTLPYMPPEQVKGQDIDGRADLFAVGAVLFRIVAQRRVHEADTESEMLVKMSATAAPALCSVAPSLPTDLGAVIDRALAYERDRRYPDARNMQADVRALRAGQPPSNALRMLSEQGAPSELGEPATRRPGSAPVVGVAAVSAAGGSSGPVSRITRVATPAAALSAQGPDVAAGQASPLSATAAAPSVQVSPLSATAAATPFEPTAVASEQAPVGAAYGAAAAAASPVGMPKTQAIVQQLPGALAEGTQVSSGVMPEATQLSAGGVALAAGAATASMAGSRGSPVLVASAASGPASSAFVAAPDAQQRHKRVVAIVLMLSGVMLLCLIVGLWLGFSGDEESGEESDEGRSRSSKSQRGAANDEDDDAITSLGTDGGGVPVLTPPTSTATRPPGPRINIPTATTPPSPPGTKVPMPGTPPTAKGKKDKKDKDDKKKGKKH